MRDEEYSEQVALMIWSTWASKRIPELNLLYASANGGKRDRRTAVKLKNSGVKAGVPDLCLPVPRGKWHGLYIELKTKNGQVTMVQKGWLIALAQQGYLARVCRGWNEARELITDYLAGKITGESNNGQ